MTDFDTGDKVFDSVLNVFDLLGRLSQIILDVLRNLAVVVALGFAAKKTNIPMVQDIFEISRFCLYYYIFNTGIGIIYKTSTYKHMPAVLKNVILVVGLSAYIAGMFFSVTTL